MAAAKLSDSMTVANLVAAAEAPARRLGREEHYYGAWFGPVALLLHRVSIDVELGEMARAVATHEELATTGFASLSSASRAVHLLNVARAHSQLRHLADATDTLAEANRLAPADISSHTATPALVVDILRRTGGQVRPAALAELADRVGVSYPP